VSDDGLAVNLGGGAVTTSFTLVTPAVPGGTAAAGVKVTDAVYVPTSSPVGLTRRATLAGRAPESGVAVSHSDDAVDPVGVMVVVYVAPAALDVTLTFCAAGMVVAPCK